MAAAITIPDCPLTRRPPAGDDFLVVENVPVRCDALSATRAEARAMNTAALRLAIDVETGHVWNRAFDADLVATTAGVVPPRDALAARDAEDFAQQHDLGQRHRVLVLGSGDGIFLRALHEASGCSGVGYSAGFARGDAADEAAGLTFLPTDFHDEAAAAMAGVDAIVCRGLLARTARPERLVRLMRTAVAGRPVPVRVEVPAADALLHGGDAWDLGHASVHLFTPASLRRLLEQNGFSVERLEHGGRDGETLVCDARLGDAARDEGDEFDAEALVAASRSFEDAFHSTIAGWSARLDGWYASGKHVALFGCGPRAASLLARCDATATRVQLCVDPDPRRHRRFLPVGGHEVVAPSALASWAARADYLLVPEPGDFAQAEAAVRAAGLAEVEVAVLWADHEPVLT